MILFVVTITKIVLGRKQKPNLASRFCLTIRFDPDPSTILHKHQIQNSEKHCMSTFVYFEILNNIQFMIYHANAAQTYTNISTHFAEVCVDVRACVCPIVFISDLQLGICGSLLWS